MVPSLAADSVVGASCRTGAGSDRSASSAGRGPPPPPRVSATPRAWVPAAGCRLWPRRAAAAVSTDVPRPVAEASGALDRSASQGRQQPGGRRRCGERGQLGLEVRLRLGTPGADTEGHRQQHAPTIGAGRSRTALTHRPHRAATSIMPRESARGTWCPRPAWTGPRCRRRATAQSGTPSRARCRCLLPRREVQIEDPLEVFRLDPRPGVFNRQFHAALRGPPRAEPEHAASRHCLACVQREVQDRLAEHAGVTVDVRDRGRRVAPPPARRLRAPHPGSPGRPPREAPPDRPAAA